MKNSEMMINLFLIQDADTELEIKNSNIINLKSEFCVHHCHTSFEHGDQAVIINKVLEKNVKSNDDFFIICEDDDFLTEEYDQNKLRKIVDEAKDLGADLIFGGMSAFNNALLVSDHLFWIDYCEDPSFAIILKSFYNDLLSKLDLQINNVQDLNDFTENKFVLYPFISEKFKKNKHTLFITENDLRNKMKVLRSDSSDILKILKKLNTFYSSTVENDFKDYDSIGISTYIINLESRADRLKNIIHEFENKPEFQTKVIKACINDIGAIGLLESIRVIIKMAIKNEDDVIVIVEDDHVFTPHYDRNTFIKNVIEAGKQGADILSGGISGGFKYAIPITNNRYWINYFWGSQFIVVYKKFFKTIIETEFVDTDTADDLLSNLSFNKMVLFPFISVQKDFGYSDITKIDSNRGDLSKIFVNAERKLGIIEQASHKFKRYK